MSQINASNVATILNLTDSIRHTFVIDNHAQITLLLNQFQAIDWKLEQYVQLQDCVWNSYSIFVRKNYYQVTRIDANNDAVIWYNEKTSPTWWVVKRNAAADEDAQDPVLSVYELINLIKSQTPVITPEGEIVYTIECV